MKEYNPKNWYWLVGGNETRAYSSKLGDYVPADDPTFVSWRSDGTSPTRIDTEDNLAEVLANEQVRPVVAAILDTYKDRQARGIVIQVPFKLMFTLINDVRQLQGKTAITAAQARAYVKEFM